MTTDMRTIPNGSVATPRGFSAGAVYAGLKTPGPDKLDLALLVSDHPCEVAATFTQSTIVSPSVVVSRDTVRAGGRIRGVVVNSGCANACVGEPGFSDAKSMVALAAQHAGAKPEEMLICSTGMIGVELPMALIRENLPKIKVKPDGGDEFARAIMTTDTRAKQIAVAVDIEGKAVTVGGNAKGAGMIHPNMATMLAFMTTDADVDGELLRQTLREAVGVSFNMMDIDTDTSTNDTCILLANGAAGNPKITANTPAAAKFAEAVRRVAVHLAREIARDGEGATKLIEAEVTGAASEADARKAARAVVSSPLVKTAIYGRDPNWGRILMAVGKTQIPVDESRIQVFVNHIQIVEEGKAIPFHTESVVKALGNTEVYLRIALNVGEGKATAWGCDLTEEYVVFNSAYST